MNKKGFSNLEIILIILLCSFLFFLAAFFLSQLRIKGYDSKIKNDLADMRVELKLCFDQNKGIYNNCNRISVYQPPKCSLRYNLKTFANDTSYLLTAKLCGSNLFYCADSSGFLGEIKTIAPDGEHCQ